MSNDKRINCKVCSGEMEIRYGNFESMYDDINVFVMGAYFYVCSCGHEELREDILEKVKRYVNEKKDCFPESSPWLYINMLG